MFRPKHVGVIDHVTIR